MEENIATDASEPGSEAQPENNAAPVSDGFPYRKNTGKPVGAKTSNHMTTYGK